MSYETNYYENSYNHNNQVEEYENNTTNANTNSEMSSVESWRLQTLYTDTKHVCAAKPMTDEVMTFDKLFAQQNRVPTHPSSVPVIVKDTTRPYTYYTMKSYGQAQDDNYYVNFDDHVNHVNHVSGTGANAFETEIGKNASFDDSGCVKTYLCSLLGCFACCLFQMNHV